MRCICLCTVIGLSLHSLTANSEPPPQELPPVTGVVDNRATLCLSNMTPQQPVIALTTQRFIRRMSPDAKKEQPPLILGPSNTFPAQPAAAMPSPAPTASFQALPDNNAVIPPDTQGAVGPNHLMTTLNSQVRIQDRSGTNLKTVSLTSFWTPVGGISFAFDPHIRFDPYGGRWIFTAAANQAAMDSALLIGVSATSDPTGDWYLFKIRADATGATWVDYPALGFNKDWIVISANMFTLVGSYAGVNVYVLGKEDLYGNGTGDYRLFQDKSGLGFTILPCVTYDATLSTQYLIEDYGRAGKRDVPAGDA